MFILRTHTKQDMVVSKVCNRSFYENVEGEEENLKKLLGQLMRNTEVKRDLFSTI